MKKLLGLAMLLLILTPIVGLYSAEVEIGKSNINDTYYQGETMSIYVSFLSTSGEISIEKVNVSIWRVEERVNRLYNVERVFNDTYEINVKVKTNEVYSTVIEIKLDFRPAQYNISVSAFVDGTKYYIIGGKIFTLRASFEIPILVWAAIIIGVLLGLSAYIYRKLKA